MAPIAEQHRFTVLLADEQERWHQTVRGLLEPQGVQTISARSGREALDKIQSQPSEESEDEGDMEVEGEGEDGEEEEGDVFADMMRTT